MTATVGGFGWLYMQHGHVCETLTGPVNISPSPQWPWQVPTYQQRLLFQVSFSAGENFSSGSRVGPSFFQARAGAGAEALRPKRRMEQSTALVAAKFQWILHKLFSNVFLFSLFFERLAQQAQNKVCPEPLRDYPTEFIHLIPFARFILEGASGALACFES